ncbi:MAG TPA: phosphatidylinositol-specific phospholipase C domain-containing protein [Actinomycetota bacterium]|nr:phosphatidylinositol-specific phospholipase C domain-containing protein [Actinomycetota bacterium]
MGSYNTTLGLVNLSGKGIRSTDITIDHDEDWDYLANDPDRDKPWRPDLNFTGPLANNDSRNEREEINSGTDRGCWFSIGITFDDNSTLNFRANQGDAYSQGSSGVYTDSLTKSAPQNDYLEVYQSIGEDSEIYSNSYYIRPAATPDNSGWMGRLLAVNPTVRLNEITMPGSHDAGMYRPGVTTSANTQHLPIYDQLTAGARYFDLRVCAWNVTELELWTYHGASYGGRLDDILDDVKRFIVANPTEAVFLKFRSNVSGDQKPTVDLVTSKLAGHLYSAASTPVFPEESLANLKGKVVAAFHPDYDPSLINSNNGTFPYSDYGNEDSGAFLPHSDNHYLGVYDSYSNDNAIRGMSADQQQKRTSCAGVGNDYLFLFSWTLTGKGSIYNLDLLSSTANPQLPRALHASGNRPNIVYIDAVDPWICGPVIAMNPGL